MKISNVKKPIFYAIALILTSGAFLVALSWNDVAKEALNNNTMFNNTAANMAVYAGIVTFVFLAALFILIRVYPVYFENNMN